MKFAVRVAAVLAFAGFAASMADNVRLGRPDARLVSQPALLQMLADEAGKHPGFRLDCGVTVRDFLREGGN